MIAIFSTGSAQPQNLTVTSVAEEWATDMLWVVSHHLRAFLLQRAPSEDGFLFLRSIIRVLWHRYRQSDAAA